MKIAACVLAVVANISCFAQAPAFEAASVRLHDGPMGMGNPVQVTADSLTLRGFSLQNCIQMAWHLPEAKVSGPAWMNDVRLDIAAKTSGPAEQAQIFLMLRTLLQERMGVIAHTEVKETPVYALTLGKGGPKFSASTSPGEQSARNANGITSAEHVTMANFAVMLSQGFGRPFVDATGLKGIYDIRIDTRPYKPAAPAEGDRSSQMDDVGILIAALREQAGLKIESRKDNIEVLIVDHAEKTPTEN